SGGQLRRDLRAPRRQGESAEARSWPERHLEQRRLDVRYPLQVREGCGAERNGSTRRAAAILIAHRYYPRAETSICAIETALARLWPDADQVPTRSDARCLRR